MPFYGRLDQIRPVSVRLVEVTSHFRLFQVRIYYVSLRQLRRVQVSLYQVKSGQVRLGNVSSGYFRIFEVSSGKLGLCILGLVM
jgi:hypothetical protein